MLVDENIIWKKVFLGFVINLLVVIAAGWIFISRLNNQRDKTMDSLLDWIEISLFVLSIILLIVVYFIIKSQLRAKKITQNHCTIADSYFSLLLTIHPIYFIKNGEYLLINKQFCDLFELSNDAI
jgi:uncharacterized protein involved in cysteine biosynthesis